MSGSSSSWSWSCASMPCLGGLICASACLYICSASIIPSSIIFLYFEGSSCRILSSSPGVWCVMSISSGSGSLVVVCILPSSPILLSLCMCSSIGLLARIFHGMDTEGLELLCQFLHLTTYYLVRMDRDFA